MIDPEVPHKLPMRPVMHQFGRYLDTYQLTLGVDTDYHAGKNDTDIIEFVVIARYPEPAKIKTGFLIAHIDTSLRRPWFYRVNTFDGGRLKSGMHMGGYKKLLEKWGDEFEALGFQHSQLGEYMALASCWNNQADRRVTRAEIIEVLNLPLDSFDRKIVLEHGMDLVPQMREVANLPRAYLASLFNLEELRQRDLLYKSINRYGRSPFTT